MEVVQIALTHQGYIGCSGAEVQCRNVGEDNDAAQFLYYFGLLR